MNCVYPRQRWSDIIGRVQLGQSKEATIRSWYRENVMAHVLSEYKPVEGHTDEPPVPSYGLEDESTPRLISR